MDQIQTNYQSDHLKVGKIDVLNGPGSSVGVGTEGFFSCGSLIISALHLF